MGRCCLKLQPSILSTKCILYNKNSGCYAVILFRNVQLLYKVLRIMRKATNFITAFQAVIHYIFPLIAGDGLHADIYFTLFALIFNPRRYFWNLLRAQ